MRNPARIHEHSSTTLAVDSKRLPEITEKIARFRSELMELLQHDRAHDDVYRFEISLFPITQTPPAKENHPSGIPPATSHPGVWAFFLSESAFGCKTVA